MNKRGFKGRKLLDDARSLIDRHAKTAAVARKARRRNAAET